MTLRRLIEAVGEGTIAPHDLDAFIPVFGLTTQCNDALDAYRGSLDAAKRLHDALLPGWAWRLEARAALVCRRKDDFTRAGCAKDPARAWLLAILRALDEREGGD